MKLLYVSFFIIFPFLQEKQAAKEKAQLIETDKAFSNLSKQKGMRYAFLKFIDDEGVLLKPGHYPLIGQDAKDIIQKTNDSSFTLTWEPFDAIVAKSGELGYTYGIYTTHTKDTTLQGTYVSIWKKQKDGNWKFVLDTGNPGVGK